jgi:hypothetical protein
MNRKHEHEDPRDQAVTQLRAVDLFAAIVTDDRLGMIRAAQTAPCAGCLTTAVAALGLMLAAQDGEEVLFTEEGLSAPDEYVTRILARLHRLVAGVP